MVFEEKKENSSGLEKATEKQLELITQLRKEAQYEKLWGNAQDTALTKGQAMELIDYLKEVKYRRGMDNAPIPRTNGFDKISYAMIYKLAFNSEIGQALIQAHCDNAFKEYVAEEYERFKACADYAKATIAEGGQQ